MTTINYTAAGPIAASFHKSTAFIRGIRGPIGCLSGDSLIITDAGLRRIDALTRPTRVLSYDKTTGRFLFVLTNGSFPKGTDALYRVLTPHGEWRAAGHHRVLCEDGKYRQIQSIFQDQSAGLCFFFPKSTNFGRFLLWLQINAHRWFRIGVGLRAHYVKSDHQRDPLLLMKSGACQVPVPLAFGAPIFDAGVTEAIHTHLSLSFVLPSTQDFVHREGARLDDSAHAPLKLGEHTDQSSPTFFQFRKKLNALVSKFLQRMTYSASTINRNIISITQCSTQEPYWDLQVPNTHNYVTADGAIHHNSGKSVACCMDMMAHALQQPVGNDGWARSRVVIIRNTFPELKSTTIRTWLDWFPEEIFGKVRWDSPITHKMTIGPKRELEAIFLALDRPDDVKKLLSLETSWAWLNEVRELPKAVLDATTGRVGRYPSARTGAGIFHPCVIMDTNPPDDDHWFYKLSEEERPENMDFFSQPSGLSDDAENLDWLNQTPETLKLPLGHPARRLQGRQYYERLSTGKNENWLKVYVQGEYGSIADGRPVFPEFNDRVHVSETMLAGYPALTLYLGWDFGLTPACVFFQISARGQLRVLDELIGEDVGLQQFIDTAVKPLIAMKYPGYKIISLHDPAGTQRSQANEITCRQILRNEGMNPSSVSTNLFVPRREAVAYFLTRLIDGEPAFLLSPAAKRLRKGLNGDYRFKRVNVPGEDRYKDVPDKNMSSHVCEALGYGCIHFHNPGRAATRPVIPRAPKYLPAATAGY